MPHVLIVGGMGPTIRDVSGLGIDISMFQHAALVRPETPQLSSRLYVFDYEQQEESVSLARWLHARHPIDVAISFTESGVEVAAAICAQLGISGNPPEAVRLSRDKHAMRELMRTRGMPAVRFRKCMNAEDARDFCRELGAPAILKPVSGSGSAGVCLVEAPERVDDAWARIGPDAALGVLAEEFFDGPEYSVEALSVDGMHRMIMVTEKLTSDAPYFIESGHQMPASLADGDRERIEATVFALLDAIGHRLGPSHTELRLTAQGHRIIETHTRPGGDFLPVLVEGACGVDLVRETLASIGGKTPLASVDLSRAPAAMAIRFFTLSDVVIVGISGLDDAAAMPGVEHVVCDIGIGDAVGPPTSSDSRQGFIVARGATLEEAQQRVMAAMARVSFATG